MRDRTDVDHRLLEALMLDIEAPHPTRRGYEIPPWVLRELISAYREHDCCMKPAQSAKPTPRPTCEFCGDDLVISHGRVCGLGEGAFGPSARGVKP